MPETRATPTAVGGHAAAHMTAEARGARPTNAGREKQMAIFRPKCKDSSPTFAGAQDRFCLNDNARFVRVVSLNVLKERIVENYENGGARDHFPGAPAGARTRGVGRDPAAISSLAK